MKLVKVLVIIVIIIGALGFFAYNTIHVEAKEEDLPEDVYENNGDLLLLVNANMIELFVTQQGDEYTVVEETINLIILDTIRENVNSLYDPLGSCDTDECNLITSTEDYYVNYIWADLSDDNQLVMHVSIGSDKYIHINTIIHLYFDIEFDYVNFGFVLELTGLVLNELSLSMDRLDQLLEYVNKEEIEASVTMGELDMDALTYTVTFPSLIPSFFD